MNADARLAIVSNRQKRGPQSSPTPAEVHAARAAANLTQTEAGTKIRAGLRAWQHYEAAIGAPDHRDMPPGLFELFLIKTGQPLPGWMKAGD